MPISCIQRLEQTASPFYTLNPALDVASSMLLTFLNPSQEFSISTTSLANDLALTFVSSRAQRLSLSTSDRFRKDSQACNVSSIATLCRDLYDIHQHVDYSLIAVSILAVHQLDAIHCRQISLRP